MLAPVMLGGIEELDVAIRGSGISGRGLDRNQLDFVDQVPLAQHSFPDEAQRGRDGYPPVIAHAHQKDRLFESLDHDLVDSQMGGSALCIGAIECNAGG